MNFNELITRLYILVDESDDVPVEIMERARKEFTDPAANAKTLMTEIGIWHMLGVDLLPYMIEHVLAGEKALKEKRFA